MGTTWTFFVGHNREVEDNVKQRMERISSSGAPMIAYCRSIVDTETESRIYSSFMNNSKRNVITLSKYFVR